MKRFKLPFIHLLSAANLMLSAFILSSCRPESVVDYGESPYEYKTLIKILDIETSKEKVLGEGKFPRISPFNDKILFAGNDGLYCINADSSGALKLISGSYIQNYNFSPDGKQIVLRLVENTSSSSWTNALYVVNIDGSGTRKILTYKPPYDPSPVFSPAMDRIVFTDSKDIVSVDLQGNNYKVIKTKTDTSYYQFIHFLPADNDRLIYFEYVQDKNQNTTGKYLKIYSISTGKETLIRKFDPAFDPEFSENGKMLLTYSLGTWHTGIFDINNNFVFSDILKDYYWSSISFDGTKIVSSNLFSIQLINSDGKNAVTIRSFSDSVQILNPRLTRDKKHIVYEYGYEVPKY